VDTAAAVPEPYAGELAGEWQRAAREWRRLDSPYEAALALTEADDEASASRLPGFLRRSATPRIVSA
jgi:hypothetical protein